MGAQPIPPSTGFRPPISHNVSADTTTMSNQQKSGAPVLDSFATQHDNSEQNLVNGAAQDAMADGEKA